MPETTQPAPALTARETVTSWLAGFGDALAAGDPAAAAALFTHDCYWRDLIAFTWNIKTMEGRGEIADMLAATLPWVPAGHWQITGGEEPAEADGVIEAWIDFETAAGRGCGHLRLARRPVLDAADHAVRAEGPRGTPAGRAARRASQHGADPARTHLAGGPRAGGRPSWASPSSRTC